MVNEILRGISAALSREFTEKEYEIYVEEIRQGLQEPCFFVSAQNPSSQHFLEGRYLRRCPILIQFFPENGKQEICHDVAERMIACLEYITLPGEEQPIWGKNPRYEIHDGVMSFFLDYDLFVLRKEDQEKMGELLQKGKAR